jgi:tetratricopeptide (TPR) repeat protein
MPTPQPKPIYADCEHALKARDWEALEWNSLRLLKADPTDAPARSYYGVALSTTDRTEEGLAEHKKAILLGDDIPMAWVNYSEALLLLDRQDESIEAALTAVEVLGGIGDELFQETYGHLVRVYIRTERVDQTDDVVIAFFRQAPPNWRLQVGIQAISTDERMYRLNAEFKIEVSYEEGHFTCRYAPLKIYGTAPSFTNALDELFEDFDVLYSEYVETDDPLHESGEELAVQIRNMVEVP